jgi:hypothetical protein
MKEYFLDNRTNILKRENNQENDNMAIVILNDSSKTPVELLVIYQVPLATYLYAHNDDNSINQVFKKNIVHKLVTLLIDSFSLSSLLDRYFIIGEPALDNDKVPFVLNNSEYNTLADLIKIKPVLSFGKKEQYVAITTYQDFICPVELVY